MAPLLFLVAGLAIGASGTVLAMRWRTHHSEQVRNEHRESDDLDPDELARLALALDALPIGVVMTDPAGRVVFRNALGRHMVGARPADVLIEEAVETHAKAAVRGEERRQTLELFGPPKKVVLVHAMPVDSGVRGALATIEDITERSRLDAVRTDFVANISHELKTPVGALLLLAEAMAESDDAAITSRLTGKVLYESQRLSRTIDDLLELSQIELGGQTLQEVVPTGLVIAEAVDRVRPLAERRSIVLTAREPSARLKVLGDRRQLVSALANLVENGVKYSEPGGEVVVQANTDGTWVDLVVTDGGIGIPTRDLDRIFERFYRVDRARSRETGGTGLGLSIVRHVATNHGGRVSVRSVEGEGSVFTLRIPAKGGEPLPVEATGAGEPDRTDGEQLVDKTWKGRTA
jgi:two-component system sensor histidine kinase SenX3